MKLNNKKVTKLKGDASERKFYRSKNSIIIFSKKIADEKSSQPSGEDE